MCVTIYSNEYETYEILKLVVAGKTQYIITQDGVFSDSRFGKLKDAKKCIDNQEVRW